MQIISKQKDNLGIEQSTFKGIEFNLTKSVKNFRSWKDEFITKVTNGINNERIGTKWKPITEKRVAIKVNRHPHLKDSQEECNALYKRCLREGFIAFNAVTKGL